MRPYGTQTNDLLIAKPPDRRDQSGHSSTRAALIYLHSSAERQRKSIWHAYGT
jgi:hypothetical protein